MKKVEILFLICVIAQSLMLGCQLGQKYSRKEIIGYVTTHVISGAKIASDKRNSNLCPKSYHTKIYADKKHDSDSCISEFKAYKIQPCGERIIDTFQRSFFFDTATRSIKEVIIY